MDADKLAHEIGNESLVQENELVKRNKKLELLNELIIEISYKQSGDELLNTALKKICEIIGVDFGYMLSFLDNNNTRSIIAKHNIPYEFWHCLDKVEYEEKYLIKISDKGIIIRLADEFKNLNRIEIIKEFSIKSVVGIPIVGRDKIPIGRIILFSTKHNDVFHIHRPFLEAVGNVLLILLKGQQEVAKENSELIRIEKLKTAGELAGGIAHDFNNILTAIIGYSQMALLKSQNYDIKNYLDIIYKSALDGKAVVDKIQSIIKKKTNKKRGVFKLNSIVETGLEMAKPRWKNDFESHNIKLEIVKEFNSRSDIYCNEFEMREVVLNIILNAIDAMEDGGRLIVKTYDSEDKACIHIEDTGTGMTEEVRARIFEPFYSTKKARGTGLGLSITKRIISGHDGEILVESTLGMGTKFIISLDIQRQSEEVIIEENVIQSVSFIEVLVVDDKRLVAQAIAEMLEALGIRADFEVDNERVIEKMSKNKYDLVICDLAMPGMNGIELAEIIKRTYPYMKVILMTGWPGDISKDNLDAIDYILEKPCTLEDLVEGINTVIEN